MSAAEVGIASTTSISDPGVRSNVYSVLARCFRFPDQELVNGLLAGGHVLGVFWALNSLLEPRWAAPLTDLGQWLSSRQRRTLHRQLSSDYARLFVAGARPTIAPLYESIYANRLLLPGDRARSVLTSYSESRLTARIAHSDLPDHLSTELEFMQCLARAEGNAAQDEDHSGIRWWVERQGEFLRGHLGWWVPLCTQKVSSGAQTPFYRLLAGATERFVLWDLERHASEGEAGLAGERCRANRPR